MIAFADHWVNVGWTPLFAVAAAAGSAMPPPAAVVSSVGRRSEQYAMRSIAAIDTG